MKKIMYTWCVVIELIIAMLVSMFVFFGVVDANIGLVLENEYKYVPIVLTAIGLVILILSFFINKRNTFITVIVMAFICIYALVKYLDHNSIYEVNKIIWLYSYCLIIVHISSLLSLYANIRVLLKSKNDKCLPVGIYSKFQLICQYIYYALAGIMVTVIIILYFIHKISIECFTICLLVLAILTLCLVFTLIITDPIRKAQKYICNELSFESIKMKSKKLKEIIITRSQKII